METAVLDGIDVILDEDYVWAGAEEEYPPGIRLSDEDLAEITDEDLSKMNGIARAGVMLRRKGHDVIFVDESDDDFDIRKFIDKKTLEYLDAMKLD